MARTRKAARRSAQREAMVSAYLDDLLEDRVSFAELSLTIAQNRFDAECMSDALRMFKADYPERCQ